MPSQDNLGPSLSAPSVIPHHPTSNHTQAAAPIYSPIPTSTSLPQILNQDVISSLLGLPSRSSSSSSKDRYEGDNEAGASDGGTSDNSGAFDAGSDDVAFHDTETPQRKGVGVVLGDVTPRPTLRPELGLGQTKPRAAVASANASPLAASARTASPKPNSNLGASRPLKPFEADSALWPYPRAPIVEDEEIVELDFADTGALSDMSAFHRRAAARRNQGGNGKANGRKSKEERAADSQRERDEIEKSWDVPMPIVPPAPAPVAAVAPAPIVNGPVRHPDVTRPPVSTVNAGKVDPDVARQSVDAVVTLQATLPSGLERNQFVREVLTLIHVSWVPSLFLFGLGANSCSIACRRIRRSSTSSIRTICVAWVAHVRHLFVSHHHHHYLHFSYSFACCLHAHERRDPVLTVQTLKELK
jgi:hypothetical protein